MLCQGCGLQWPSFPVLSEVQSQMNLTLLQNVFVEDLGSLRACGFSQGCMVTAGESPGILAPALLCLSAALTSPAGTEPQMPQLPVLALMGVIYNIPTAGYAPHSPHL